MVSFFTPCIRPAAFPRRVFFCGSLHNLIRKLSHCLHPGIKRALRHVPYTEVTGRFPGLWGLRPLEIHSKKEGYRR